MRHICIVIDCKMAFLLHEDHPDGHMRPVCALESIRSASDDNRSAIPSQSNPLLVPSVWALVPRAHGSRLIIYREPRAGNRAAQPHPLVAGTSVAAQLTGKANSHGSLGGRANRGGKSQPFDKIIAGGDQSSAPPSPLSPRRQLISSWVVYRGIDPTSPGPAPRSASNVLERPYSQLTVSYVHHGRTKRLRPPGGH